MKLSGYAMAEVYGTFLIFFIFYGQLIHGKSIQSNEVPGCSHCAPGFGVKRHCNGTVDTLCQACPQGTFNEDFTVDKSCAPCGSCTIGFYERTPCISTQDVQCGSCDLDNGGFGNEDFRKKCESRTTTSPPTTSTTTITTTSTKADLTTTKNVLPFSTSRQDIKTTVTSLSSSSFITPTTTTTTTTTTTSSPPLRETTEEEGSGEGSGDGVVVVDPGDLPIDLQTDGFLPVKTTKYPPLEQTTQILENETLLVVAAEVGGKIGSGFQWPILVTVICAAVVCFILGILCSILLQKKGTYSTGEKKGLVKEEDSKALMFENKKYEDPLQEEEEEEKKPMFTSYGGPPSEENAPPAYRATPPPKPRRTFGIKGNPFAFLKRDKKHFSRDLRYIDEDSDDEIAQQIGRPPSVNYKDSRKKRRSHNKMSKYKPKKPYKRSRIRTASGNHSYIPEEFETPPVGHREIQTPQLHHQEKASDDTVTDDMLYATV